jgi:hypothetical protein
MQSRKEFVWKMCFIICYADVSGMFSVLTVNYDYIYIDCGPLGCDAV